MTGDNGEIDGILYIIAFNLNRYLLSRSKYSHIYKIIIAMSLEKSQLYYILKLIPNEVLLWRPKQEFRPPS